ncbi:hypothetical protein KEH51_15790 [[Brevibacterium] frigoritolerans]|uniref:Uncharacterized protein n=1 Tax=Peribacillus frigoritolerans TaxID=450367 RepID=A0A941J7Y5_9BACI|nr:hypothetical protein [Peribacillus frigoritolerans]
MHKILKDKSEVILPLLTEWFNKPEWAFSKGSFKFNTEYFPEFDEPLQDYLKELIDSNDIEDAKKSTSNN